jgi:hypothetical protein
MTLAIAEPRLRGSRKPSSGPLEASEHPNPRAHAQLPQTAQTYETMLSWSPWSTMLRQQALLAEAFLSMIKAHQALVQNWTFASRKGPK